MTAAPPVDPARVGRAHARMAAVGASLLGVLAVAALLAPLLAPYDPHAPVGLPLEAPSGAHWLGTNDVGQDVLSRVMWGARSALAVAAAAALASVAVGLVIGTGAGLLGGVADLLLMRATDVFLALPAMPLLILVVALVGAGRTTLVVVIAAFSWPWTARIARSHVLQLRTRGFVQAAGGFGARPRYVMRRHLVPAVWPLAVAGLVEVASVAIVVDAGLAFLGLADPTTSTWGLMLNRATTYPGVYYSPAWTWWVLPPGVAVTAAVLGLTFVGMGLSSVRQRGVSAETTATS